MSRGPRFDVVFVGARVQTSTKNWIVGPSSGFRGREVGRRERAECVRQVADICTWKTQMFSDDVFTIGDVENISPGG